MSDLLPKHRESVFIGSTVHDLVDLRSELTSFLRELGRLALLDAGQRESLSWMRGEVMGEPHEYEFVLGVSALASAAA